MLGAIGFSSLERHQAPVHTPEPRFEDGAADGPICSSCSGKLARRDEPVLNRLAPRLGRILLCRHADQRARRKADQALFRKVFGVTPRNLRKTRVRWL